MEFALSLAVTVLALVASLPFCRYARVDKIHAMISALAVFVVAIIVANITNTVSSTWSVLDWMPLVAFCVLPLTVISRVLASEK